MLVFPNCKINLGLHILRKREDGFHDLETIFYPVGLRDSLEVIQVGSQQSAVSSSQSVANIQGSTDFNFSQSGLMIDGKLENNLCYKAYQLLKKDFSQLPAIQMHLHKAIPMGSGLGGGSADAAFALKLLNNKFHLNLSAGQLINYSASLGSDAPFFIINKPCFASGRGEILEEIKIDLSGYTLILVNPGIHINTGQAFSQLRDRLKWPANSAQLKEIIQQPVQTWKEKLMNDFEIPVFEQHPEIAAIKKTMYEEGALYSAMSGSGSTVFGIFAKNEQSAFRFPANYFIKSIPA